ncbi:hypothetical protein BaRGS_00024245 [Batillaria attramentaria]|uniref:Secreted protein n=1 Tax=Batillaria attramentaria TaxID=370345 RepID=A0ABD0KBL5_9CAEN
MAKELVVVLSVVMVWLRQRRRRNVICLRQQRLLWAVTRALVVILFPTNVRMLELFRQIAAKRRNHVIAACAGKKNVQILVF